MKMNFGVFPILLIASLLILSVNISPAQAVTQELAYDDGTEDMLYGYEVGWQCAVKFSLPEGWISAKILTAKYFFWISPLLDFEVHIYDSDGTTDLITPFSFTIPPGIGWFNVDLSSLNIVVDDDFYIVIEWLYNGQPEFGWDTTSPCNRRSFHRKSASDVWGLDRVADYMIRAVVEEQELPGVPEFPLGTALEIALIPVLVYMATRRKWKTTR